MIFIPDWMMTFSEYTFLGMEHIWLGYDHLLFVFALLMGKGSRWDYIKTLSAFTIGHTITLGLASMEILMIPSSIIEPLIALSIVYVAVESLVKKSLKGRWFITLLFGLIHGFGFAGVLKGYLGTDFVLQLFAFNIGVEIGQIAVVFVIIPLFLYLRKASWEFTVMVSFSVSVGLIGSYWFIERIIHFI